MANTTHSKLTDSALIDQSMHMAINELQQKVNKGEKIAMSEFTKILIWASNEKKLIWEQEMRLEKKHGTKYEERKWCGVPYEEFKIPSLGIF